jgi:hypothetical protein
MTVILRIDGGLGLFAVENVENVRTQLSPFLTSHPYLGGRRSAGRTVWHTGCPIYGCEGLSGPRNLGKTRLRVGDTGKSDDPGSPTPVN